MREPEDADVCVIGAGYAGLTAARRLAAAGRAVVVLEARARVGGRIWSHRLDDGSVVDRGGAWLAQRHDAIFALANELGASTYKTWVKGTHLLVGEGRTRRYTGLIPKISPTAVVTIALAQFRIDRLARTVPLEAPWTAARAAKWDAETVASYLSRTRISSSIGGDLYEMAVRGLFAADLNDVSFLHLLYLVRAHGSINTLFSIEGGSQENLVDGGAGSIAQRIADQLGDAIRLNQAVHSISQQDDRVVVNAAGSTVRARHAVVAVPPAIAAEIEFEPSLSRDRLGLLRLAIGGLETKTMLVYDEPFWRDEGLSGQTAEPNSAAEVTIDGSPSSGSPGVLASFTFGRVARQLDALDDAERRRAVLDAISARFGRRAATPASFIETSWWNEPWTRGCSMAHLPTGAITRYGALMREPFGRIHWAGTETSTTSHGSIDGAVRSGERAAAEILDRS
jgi:monoamine oxidase